MGDDALDDAALVASDNGVRFERELIAGDAGGVIVALANAIDADLVVVGERPRRLRVGPSVSRWVSRHTRRPVLVARQLAGGARCLGRVGPVLVALQGNPRDDAAVDHEAAAWARKSGGGLVGGPGRAALGPDASRASSARSRTSALTGCCRQATMPGSRPRRTPLTPQACDVSDRARSPRPDPARAIAATAERHNASRRLRRAARRQSPRAGFAATGSPAASSASPRLPVFLVGSLSDSESR